MEKLRFGIIGTGRISDWVLKGAGMDPRFEAVAVCSRTKENGGRFASCHDIPKVCTDVDEMASDPGVDAVYIGTPNQTHHDLAIRCMRHGKHVLCEKPMASNAREVREMIAVAKEKDVVLMEAMISTLSPNYRKMQETLKELGDVRHWFASFCQYSSKYDLVKRIIAGEADAPVPCSLNPDCSGGALSDIGIYTIYPMVTLFGRPKGIKADVTTCMVPAGGEWKKIDLQGSVSYDYDGMTATAIYSKIVDSNLKTEIACDKGVILMDRIHITKQMELIMRGAPTSGRSLGPEAVDISATPDADEYLCEFREFIDVVQSGRKESANNSLGNSLIVAEIMEEIRHQAGIVYPADQKAVLGRKTGNHPHSEATGRQGGRNTSKRPPNP